MARIYEIFYARLSIIPFIRGLYLFKSDIHFLAINFFYLDISVKFFSACHFFIKFSITYQLLNQ